MKPWADIEALESTLGVTEAAGRTYCPSELLARAPAAASAPLDDVSLPTSVVYEAIQQRSAEPGPAAERFEIRSTLGEGGMGVVSRALQVSLQREVAVKKVRDPGPAAEHYFLSEARITARLEHANIVPVHLLSRAEDGSPLLAMKLVKGTSWSDLIDGPDAAATPLKEHLRILLAVCNGVAYAHRQGILHRDLKPDNVMVGELGQVLVMDWGVAVGLDAEACDRSGILHVSAVRSPAGTPGFMAPELARGEGERQSVRTDVYLLGACLHAVLTRRAPHTGGSVREVLEQAIESRPLPYPDDVPRELTAIVRRAMAREPDDRYPDVESFQAALEAFLEHRAAYALIDDGREALTRMKAAIEAFGAAAPDDQAGHARAVEQAATVGRFAFERALAVWEGAAEAREGRDALCRMHLDHAVAAGDLALATRLLPDVDTAAARAQVAALKARLDAETAELSALRDTARRLDWSAIAPALSAVFLVTGALGGAGAALSWAAQRQAYSSTVPVMGAIWISLALFAGVYALVRLRGSGARDNLLSPRVLVGWGAVVLGCVINGVAAYARGRPPFEDAHVSTAMLGIGFAAMAVQTRLWLLWPAAAFFIGAVVMGIWPSLGLPIFGLLWVTTLCGVGLAFRLGATLGKGR
ncbi:MAG: serine/threonine-protein kinase [Byssovorax sp.]